MELRTDGTSDTGTVPDAPHGTSQASARPTGPSRLLPGANPSYDEEDGDDDQDDDENSEQCHGVSFRSGDEVPRTAAHSSRSSGIGRLDQPRWTTIVRLMPPR
jgi:hypothetical protein